MFPKSQITVFKSLFHSLHLPLRLSRVDDGSDFGFITSQQIGIVVARSFPHPYGRNMKRHRVSYYLMHFKKNEYTKLPTLLRNKILENVFV